MAPDSNVLDEGDRIRLSRALALARKSQGFVEPNPPVGCVVAQDGTVVGESWHKAWGGAHAEVEALNMAGEQARGATLYVSLEPCSRAGKTSACTDRIISAGVKRVVYAVRDPHPEQGGRADAILRDAGIDVVSSADPTAGEALLARFHAALSAARPWTIAKWAMTLDGRIAPMPGQRCPITGSKANLLAHIMRGRMDAIAVGVRTVRIDDPRLTCRLESGPPDGRDQPLRVVFASELDVPLDSQLVRTAAVVPVLVIGGPEAPESRHRALQTAGCEVVRIGQGEGGLDLSEALALLKTRGVERLLVEGGGRIHGALFAAGLVDQVCAYVAPMIIGSASPVVPVLGQPGASLPETLHLRDTAWRRLGSDLMLTGFTS